MKGRRLALAKTRRCDPKVDLELSHYHVPRVEPQLLDALRYEQVDHGDDLKVLAGYNREFVGGLAKSNSSGYNSSSGKTGCWSRFVMETILAVFENGVFRPVAPVALPEHAEVEFEPRLVQAGAARSNGSSDALDGVYSILSERYESGHTDTAARHDEHQP